MIIDKKKIEKEAQIVLNNYKSGNFNNAENKAKQIIKKHPGYAAMYNILGLSLTKQHKNVEAIKTYQEALALKPDFAIVHNNLGNLLSGEGKKHEARECYLKAIKYEPKFALAHNNLGNLFKDQNNFKEAVNCFEKALKCEPNLFVVYSNLGVAYQNLGKFDEAAKCYRRSLKINPNFSIAHRHLSMTTKYTEDNKHLKEMENIISDSNITDEQKMDLSFGLGKAYEDIKKYKKAFEYYKRGNEIKRNSINYDLALDIELFQHIKEVFNQNAFNNLKNIGNNDKTPIFVLGMPRSGTTLVEQILSSHPSVFGAGELNNFNYLIKENFMKKNKIRFTEKLTNADSTLFKKMGNSYIKSIKELSQNSERVSDKALLNFRWIGLIKISLPNAKIIHCTRDSRDNCLSIFKNFFAGDLGFAYNLKELGYFHNIYRDLMAHWNNVLPNYIYNISYEKLIQNQKEETYKLLKFCNLEWSENCMKFHKNSRPIATASLAQARRPIYKDSMQSWKKYESQLSTLLNTLNKSI